jgi:hypothetical protein
VNPAVAVLHAGADTALRPVGELAVDAIVVGLRDRLADVRILPCTLGDPGDPGLAGSEPRRPLTPWRRATADSLRAEVGAVAVVSSSPAGSLGETIIDDLSVRGVGVDVIPIGEATADPLSLSGRLVGDPGELADRREYLRQAGLLPKPAGYLLSFLGDAPEGMDIAIEAFATGVRVEVAKVPAGATPADLAAMIEGAEVVITDRGPIVSLATMYLRPTIRVVRPPAPDRVQPGVPFVFQPDELLGRPGWLPPVPGKEWQEEQWRRAELLLDDVAARAARSCEMSRARTGTEEVAILEERVAVLETVNAALRERLARERSALAAGLREARSGQAEARRRRTDPGGGAAEQAALDATRAEVDRLEGEIRRIYATRTMRVLAPARRLYGRLRSTIR